MNHIEAFKALKAQFLQISGYCIHNLKAVFNFKKRFLKKLIRKDRNNNCRSKGYEIIKQIHLPGDFLIPKNTLSNNYTENTEDTTI